MELWAKSVTPFSKNLYFSKKQIQLWKKLLILKSSFWLLNLRIKSYTSKKNSKNVLQKRMDQCSACLKFFRKIKDKFIKFCFSLMIQTFKNLGLRNNNNFYLKTSKKTSRTILKNYGKLFKLSQKILNLLVSNKLLKICMKFFIF